MFLDTSQDFLTWDNTRQVVYEVARAVPSIADLPPLFDGKATAPPTPPSRNRRCFISTAKRRGLSKRELAASGGVYTGDDQVWILPDALFPPGWRSKPGDVVIDPGSYLQDAPTDLHQTHGERFTVLEVGWGKNRQTRRLTCRDLVLTHALRDSITIERPAISYDAAGVPVKRFLSDVVNPGGVPLYTGLPARAQLMSKEVAEMYGIKGLEGKYQVYVGREVDVTLEDRVLLASGLYLDIVGYQQAQRIDQLPFIVAERRI